MIELADVGNYFSFIVQSVVPGEGESRGQSTSKLPPRSTSKSVTPTVRFSLVDIDGGCDVDAALPGTSAPSFGALQAVVSDAESHTLDPFVARECNSFFLSYVRVCVDFVSFFFDVSFI